MGDRDFLPFSSLCQACLEERRYMMLIDTHAHYDDEQFQADRMEVLSSLPAAGIETVINAAQDVETARQGIALAERFPFVYCTVGIHPHMADSCTPEAMETLERLAAHPKVVAVGETGLDYHYDFSPPEVQKANFIENIRLARRVGKPLVIHDREAHGDILTILREERVGEIGGVVHCYSGSGEMAKELARMGLYFSLGGAVTFRNAKRILEALPEIPGDRLLLETDCPYMTPEPYRGRRNDSRLLPYVAQKIAALKGCSVEEIADLTNRNARALFVQIAR